MLGVNSLTLFALIDWVRQGVTIHRVCLSSNKNPYFVRVHSFGYGLTKPTREALTLFDYVFVKGSFLFII